MIWRGFRKGLPTICLLLALLAQFSVASANEAGSLEIRSSCWAAANLSEDVDTVARTEARWSCGGREVSLDAERVLLRFDITFGAPPVRYLISRRSAFASLHLLSIDRDGTVRRKTIAASALHSSLEGGYFTAPLPEVTGDTRQVIAAIDLPSHKMTLQRAYLAPTDAAGSRNDMRFLLVLAGLAGMLVMPLIFNAAFYRALREPFVLWHSALTFSLLTTILVTSGLSVMLFDPPAMTLSWLTTMIFGVTVASGAMFTYSFIEPGLMHPRLRRVLPYCAAWAILLSAFHAAFPFVARPIQSSLYTAAFAPILGIFIVSLIDSLRRGSRAARFQAIGYAPMVVVGLIRLVTGVVPSLHTLDASLLFYIGCMCEVVFTTLGVAERFVSMRRAGDRARSEAELLERLSETDPLTGLLNRRALERQFEQLRAEGFATMAVIDIDHFKTINDRHGHNVGDDVLKAVASALQASPSVRAYRLGGEEFVLFVRGHDSDRQAEIRRQAIPAIVADTVPGVGRAVTASMGVTNILVSEGFATLYERADALLYEAKNAGRNRTRSTIKPVPEPRSFPDDRAKVALASGRSS